MLEFSNLSVGYRKGPTLLDGEDGRFEEGSVNLLVGVNGVGKTAFLHTLAGDRSLIKSGNVAAEGFDSNSSTEFNKMVVSTFEDDGFINEWFTGLEYLEALSSLRSIERCSFRIIETLQMHDFVEKRIRSYSFGMRQLLRIAGVFQSHASVLIFDEPFNGLDPIKCSLVATLLHQTATSGKTVLLSSHQFLPFEKNPCKVIFMNERGLNWGGEDLRPDDLFKELSN